MIKYIKELTSVVMEEVPDRISVAVEITNCPGTCNGCHSPFLREDIGAELTYDAVDEIMEENYGVNCFLFLGEGNDPEALLKIASYVKTKYRMDIAIYSGRMEVEREIYDLFDFVKVGPYVEEFGPLNYKTTNQVMYKVDHKVSGGNKLTDITSRFQSSNLNPQYDFGKGNV